MFNVQVLNDAVAEISEAGRTEIQKMINAFEGYKSEVDNLRDLADGFERLAVKLQKEKIHLENHIDIQGKKITELIGIVEKTSEGVKVIRPKEEFIDKAHSIIEEGNLHV